MQMNEDEALEDILNPVPFVPDISCDFSTWGENERIHLLKCIRPLLPYEIDQCNREDYDILVARQPEQQIFNLANMGSRFLVGFSEFKFLFHVYNPEKCFELTKLSHYQSRFLIPRGWIEACSVCEKVIEESAFFDTFGIRDIYICNSCMEMLRKFVVLIEDGCITAGITPICPELFGNRHIFNMPLRFAAPNLRFARQNYLTTTNGVLEIFRDQKSGRFIIIAEMESSRNILPIQNRAKSQMMQFILFAIKNNLHYKVKDTYQGIYDILKEDDKQYIIEAWNPSALITLCNRV